jgi:aspartate/methionine/tyrosine aminotransferase
MDRIQAPIVPIVGDIIRQVPGTISLGQGVVHYGPPPEAIEAVRSALDRPAASGIHEYQDGAGLPELVGRISRKLARENGIDVGRGSRIMVTAGANMAFLHAVLATTVPGDEIVLPVPYYFNHEMAVAMAGCRTVPVPTDDCYGLDVGAIERAITDRTRAVVTISPNNPTGAVFSEGSLRDVNMLCRDRGVYHVSDEPYEYFTYARDGSSRSSAAVRHVSPGSFPDAEGHTISMYSMSKAYGFAGWRIGYMVYPQHLAAAMIKSQDTILICPPVASQIAAVAALDVGRSYCEPYVRQLAEVREIVVGSLSALAPLAEVPTADGAFYAFVKINADIAPMVLVERLIREHKVAVVPGSAFGVTTGCYVRVAYGALQKETVAEGIGRLVDGLRAICGS